LLKARNKLEKASANADCAKDYRHAGWQGEKSSLDQIITGKSQE
jgi:hypothetical protein